MERKREADAPKPPAFISKHKFWREKSKGKKDGWVLAGGGDVILVCVRVRGCARACVWQCVRSSIRLCHLQWDSKELRHGLRAHVGVGLVREKAADDSRLRTPRTPGTLRKYFMGI